MKRNLILLISILLFTGCVLEEVTVPTCYPVSATLFDKTSTNFTFEADDAGGQRLSIISVFHGTDSSYTYTYNYSGNQITTITKLEDGESEVYEATYSATKLTKLTQREPINNSVALEIRIVYNGNNISNYEIWFASVTGTLYQISHISYTYDSEGNITKSKSNIDLAAIFTLAFAEEPTSYSPILLTSSEYEVSGSLNPLYNTFFLDRPDQSIMRNLPLSITLNDELNGGVIRTENYSIETDANGYPTKAISGAKYVEATYMCN